MPNPPAVDPLSHLLSLLDVKSASVVRLHAGGAWAIRFPAFEHVKFGALIAGRCTVLPGGGGPPVDVKAGDCFLLTNGLSYGFRTDPDMAEADGRAVFADAVDGLAFHGTSRDGGTGRGADTDTDTDSVIVGGRFVLSASHPRMLLDHLPPLILIDGQSPAAAVLRPTLALLAHETAASRPGSSLMVARLADIMFVQALRAHLASGNAPSSGWLGALTDPQIAMALGLMHGAVAQRWSVASLAEAVGMSRSSFAQRFSAKVGMTPHGYLVHLRMRVAAESLRTQGRRVSSVAFELGYQSESAFSKAYKRVMGASPRERPAAPSVELMDADAA